MSEVKYIELDYAPRPLQKVVHKALQAHRFVVLVCHRRFGKTVLAINELIRGALTCQLQRPRYAYIGPTYRQAKAAAWDYLQHYAEPIPGRTFNQSEMRVDFPNGGQVRLFGADNPDSLRGMYFDGVVLDEYGMHAAKTFSEVIGPALTDRKGSALFVGTPNGKNQFYEISQRAKDEARKGNADWIYLEYKSDDTGIIPLQELNAARLVMTKDEWDQEFGCSFEASVRGAIYGEDMARVLAEGRITRVPLEPLLPVDTDWDLGVGDATSIWFSQSLRSGEVRLIDYYEASGEGFPFYARVLRERGYGYGKHYAPHDIAVRELGSGKSRLDIAREHGIRFEITPRITSSTGMEIEEGIHAVRMLLPKCWFDEQKCKAGIEALKGYRRDYNERLREFKASPVHDRHCFAPETRVLTRHGMRQIMDLPENGEVWTPCGWKQYEGPRITRRNAQLVRVEFEDGYTVRCTPDHTFLTVNGWRSAESLAPGSLIRFSWTHSPSTTMESFIGFGQESATSPLPAREPIGLFGGMLLGQFLTDAISIIEMGIRATMPLPIWSAYRLASISPMTGIASSLGLSTISPQMPAPVLLSGIDLKRGVFGINDTPERCDSEPTSARFVPARIADKKCSPWFERQPSARSIAGKPARLLRIASVTPLHEQIDTWCIHVPDVECFVLENGAVAHNSHAADAMRGLAVRHKIPTEAKEKVWAEMPREYAWS